MRIEPERLLQPSFGKRIIRFVRGEEAKVIRGFDIPGVKIERLVQQALSFRALARIPERAGQQNIRLRVLRFECGHSLVFLQGPWELLVFGQGFTEEQVGFDFSRINPHAIL